MMESNDHDAVVDQHLKLSLKVHEVAKDCQNQNGLRHGDYHQYRQYCTRRLKRVRSSRGVRLMFGKEKAFIQKASQVNMRERNAKEQNCLSIKSNTTLEQQTDSNHYDVPHAYSEGIAPFC